MLVAGDELERTQGGNNNAWCQDNEISWLDWRLDQGGQRLLAFTRRLIELRRRHPVFRRSNFFLGERRASRLPDAWWFRPDGARMARRDWDQADGAVGIFLNGEEISSLTPRGERVVDDSFVVLVNAHLDPVDMVLPARRFGIHWALELSSAEPDEPDPGHTHAAYAARDKVRVAGCSLVVLRRV